MSREPKVITDERGNKLRLESNWESLRAGVRDESLFHLVGLSVRPNVQFFFVMLEYTHFTPGTPSNSLFDYTMAKWEEMVFFIGSFPRSYVDHALAIARKLGLRFADGVPTLIEGGVQLACQTSSTSRCRANSSSLWRTKTSPARRPRGLARPNSTWTSCVASTNG